jgi:hypothetical protein
MGQDCVDHLQEAHRPLPNGLRMKSRAGGRSTAGGRGLGPQICFVACRSTGWRSWLALRSATAYRLPIATLLLQCCIAHGSDQFMASCVDSPMPCANELNTLCPAGFNVTRNVTDAADHDRKTMIIKCEFKSLCRHQAHFSGVLGAPCTCAVASLLGRSEC